MLVFSCSTDLIGELQDGKKYTVRQGGDDFIPSPFPLQLQAKSASGWAMFHTSCWYDNLGVDNQDWNKLAGFYRWWDIYKDKNSFILAWRPDPLRDVFQLCLYENIDGANVPKESAIYKVKSSEKFTFDFQFVDGKYRLWVNSTLLGEQANDRKYRTVGKISAWFGGNRKAPWKMWLYMNF